MALAFTSLDSAEETSTDGTMTSASLSPTSGAVLFVTIVGTNASANFAQDGSVSGLGGTWTKAADSVVYGIRRVAQVFIGTKATAWGTGTLTINAPGTQSNQDMAYTIDEATGQDSTTPTNTAVSGSGTDNLTLGDVGTVDSGDAVYVAGAHENGANNFACTGYTGITTLGSLSNVRQIRTFYDDTSPDTTPNLTSDGGGQRIGAFAFVVNVAAGGGGGRIMSSLVANGGLAGMGGLAGISGGLAG